MIEKDPLKRRARARTPTTSFYVETKKQKRKAKKTKKTMDVENQIAPRPTTMGMCWYLCVCAVFGFALFIIVALALKAK
jgi:hypothetical protein